MVKLEPNDDDESWLYGGADGASQKAAESKSIPSADSAQESRLSAEATIFEPRKKPENAEPASADAADGAGACNDDGDTENAEEEDSEDDDVQVTIGDIKTQTFDPSATKFKTPYQQQHSQGSVIAPGATTASKPPSKGIDLDAVGTINGVPVYEFDIDSFKLEDKPWRKPGADITDYFNYGFNEDTWTKYCEKQRRLRIENNSHKSGNLIFVHGSTTSHRPEPAKSVDSVNSGEINSFSASAPLRKMNNHQQMHHKISSTIDVIGSTTRDSRRPQPQDFIDTTNDPGDYQQISSVTTMLPMSMSVPPPLLNMPPPDFGMPPPPGGMPPGAMAPPPPMGHPPPGMIAPPPILVAPPPGFPPPMGGPGFDPFFRTGPGGPPPPHDRRPPPGFPDRPPPFGFEGHYGPPPFGNQPGAPPQWDNRPVDNYNMERGGGNVGGVPPPGNDRGAPSWDYRAGSPTRSETDMSSSGGDDHERRASPRKHRGRESYDRQERESRQRDRSRSHERSRMRDSDRDRGKDIDRDRSRESRDRGRDSERDRGRGRDDRDRDRSRDRDRHRAASSRDRRDAYDRERRHHREKEDRHHSRRRDDDDDRHKSKHKKEKKVKQEPIDNEGSPNAPSALDENPKA